jgi:hypothetical protein
VTENAELTEAASTAWLVAHGRRPWAEVHSLLTDCVCAWADLDGVHTEPAPTTPPLATHLWAWNHDRLLRVRIDCQDGIAAELRPSESGQGEPVTITERKAISWPSEEGRVSAAQEWRDRPLRIYQVQGLMPLEFTRLVETD